MGALLAWAQVAATDDWEDFAWTAGGQAVGLGVGGLAAMIAILVGSFEHSTREEPRSSPSGEGSKAGPHRIAARLLVGGLLLWA